MVFLIDGYNLLFGLGWASKRTPQPHLHPARTRLLNYLADSQPVKLKAARFRVVFDAVKGPFPSGPATHRDITVEFAYRTTADDYIAELVAADPTPQKLTVVSNDNHVRLAATRGRSRAWQVPEFLDWLDGGFAASQRTLEQVTAPEKPTGPADPAADAELLKAFGVPKGR